MLVVAPGLAFRFLLLVVFALGVFGGVICACCLVLINASLRWLPWWLLALFCLVDWLWILVVFNCLWVSGLVADLFG